MLKHAWTWCALALLFIAAACQPRTVGVDVAADAQDIFTADRDLARRHPATGEELLWTIQMGGCTGHLLSPNVMMSASHCSRGTPQSPPVLAVGARYRSGVAASRNQGADITVSAILENNPSLDFAIMSITWNGGAMPPEMRFPSRIATQKENVNVGMQAGQGDEVFTVGFPADQRVSGSTGATYSQGNLKNTAGSGPRCAVPNSASGTSFLCYDMGIINGNSGGGVWRKSDGMLVSLTNGGSKRFSSDPNRPSDPGWDQANIENPGSWNYGVAMWAAYAASATLKDIFPNGANKFGGATSGPGAPVLGGGGSGGPGSLGNGSGGSGGGSNGGGANPIPAPTVVPTPTEAPTPLPTPTLPPIDPEESRPSWPQIPIGGWRFL